MKQYEVISVRKSGQSMFVNCKQDGVEVKPSPSCHQKFTEATYKAIDEANLQPGDIINMDVTVNGDYHNIDKDNGFGGKVGGPNPASDVKDIPAGSDVVSAPKFRHPDEIVMQECIGSAVSLQAIKGLAAKTTVNDAQVIVCDVAMEFYKLVKDPDKNMMLSSNRSDVQNESPKLNEGELPNPIEGDDIPF